MRKILRDTCIFAALMILTVFAFSIAGVGFTEEIKLVFELFGLAFILAVINYIFDEKTSFSIIVGYLVKYLIVSVVVIAFGFIVGWFYPSNFWMAFIYVGVITVIVYALDSVKTETDQIQSTVRFPGAVVMPGICIFSAGADGTCVFQKTVFRLLRTGRVQPVQDAHGAGDGYTVFLLQILGDQCF